MQPLIRSLTLTLTLIASSVSAQVITTSPTLPASPPAFYTNRTATVLSFVGGTIRIDDFSLSNWTPTTFNAATATFNLSLNGGATFTPTQFSGPGAWSNNNPSSTGTFPTEMIQLGLSGNIPGIALRESPTLVSLGQTTVTAIGGGQFSVSSFFDVFTELSLDGGLTWSPANTSLHIELQTVPEPTALALTAIGLLALRVRMFRQSKRS